MLNTPGFLPPLVAFVASIGISNVVSAFVADELRASGFVEQGVDLAGAGFQAAIVLGGIVLGGYVDRTKEYKQVTRLASVRRFFFFWRSATRAPCPSRWCSRSCSLSAHSLAGAAHQRRARRRGHIPRDENAIEAVQQLCGNLFSALLVPIAERAGEMDVRSLPGLEVGAGLRGDYAVLGFIAWRLGYFSTFDSSRDPPSTVRPTTRSPHVT